MGFRPTTMLILHAVHAASASSTVERSSGSSAAKIIMNGASLTTSCIGRNPSVVLVDLPEGWESHYSSGAEAVLSVRLFMRGVPDTCIFSMFAAEPCHAHASYIPSLWRCSFTGPSGQSISSGPFRTGVFNYTQGGAEVYLVCPLPSPSDIHTISAGYNGEPTFAMTLGAAYGDPAAPLPFAGVPGGSVLTFQGWAPPPSAPPAAPPPPPASPPPPPPSPAPPPPPRGGLDNPKCPGAKVPGWEVILQFEDDRSRQDAPTSRGSLAAGVHSEGYYYMGNADLNGLSFPAAQLCTMSTSNCERTCYTLDSRYWSWPGSDYPYRCAEQPGATRSTSHPPATHALRSRSVRCVICAARRSTP